MDAALNLAPVALCFDCSRPLPADARYDVCGACLRAQRDREDDVRVCRETVILRGCSCGEHGAVR